MRSWLADVPGCAAAQHDQVSKRDYFFRAGPGVVEILLQRFERLKDFASSAGWLTSQSLCGSRRMRAPLAPPRFSLPRNVSADAQVVVTSWEMDSPDERILPFRS